MRHRDINHRGFLSIFAVVVLAVSMLVLAAAPHTARANEPSKVNALVDSFSKCATNAGSADVLLLFDQSSSLAGPQGSDPDNIRQKAAIDLVNQIAQYSAQTKIPVSVMASGFDGQYRGGQWIELTPERVPEAEAAVKEATIDTGQETDYWNALEGARQDLAANPSPCDLVVWFTDGEYLVEGTAYGETKPYSQRNARTDSAGVIEDAKNSICSPLQGPMNAMRASGVYVIGIGLGNATSQPDFSFLQRATLGSDGCGASPQPNRAAYLSVADAGSLVFALGSITATQTAEEPYSAEGVAGVQFGLDPYITSASVLADSGATVPGLQFGLQGPGVPDDKIAWSPPSGGTLDAPGATVEAVQISPDRAMRFNIVQKPDPAGFAGTWAVKFKAANPADVPAETFARASISVVAQLRPQWSNTVANAEVGAELPMTIAVVTTDGAPVADAIPNAQISVSWVDAADESTPLAEAPATEFAAGRNVALQTPDGAPLAPSAGQISVALNLVTAAEPPTSLRPEVVPYELALTAPVNYPTVDNSRLALTPDFVEGTAPSTGLINVTGPGCVWVDTEASAQQVSSLPDGVDSVSVSAPASASDSCLRLEEGQSQALEVQLAPNTQGNGVVTGQFQVRAAPLEEASAEPVVVPIEFTAERAKEQSGTTKWLVLFVGMVLGLGIPAGLLMWVRARSAVIPVARADSGDLVVYASKTLRLDGEGRINDAVSGSEVALAKGDFHMASSGAEDRLSVLDIDEFTIKARAWGNPFAVPDARVTSGAGPVVSDLSAAVADDGTAPIPLALQSHWVAQRASEDTVKLVAFFNSHDTGSAEGLREASDRLRDSVESQVEVLKALVAGPSNDGESAAVLVGAGGASTADGDWSEPEISESSVDWAGETWPGLDQGGFDSDDVWSPSDTADPGADDEGGGPRDDSEKTNDW